MVFHNSALMAADEHTPSVLQSVRHHGRTENEILQTMTLHKTNYEHQHVWNECLAKVSVEKGSCLIRCRRKLFGLLP